LTVSMLFRLCEDDNRRIYVSEHLKLQDSTIFREAKRLKRMNLFSRVFTRKGVVSVILLNGDERIPRDAGELSKLTIVAENYVPAVADEVTFKCWCLMIFLAKFFFSILYFDLVLSFFYVYMRIFGLFT
jgi:hypothetical protein